MGGRIKQASCRRCARDHGCARGYACREAAKGWREAEVLPAGPSGGPDGCQRVECADRSGSERNAVMSRLDRYADQYFRLGDDPHIGRAQFDEAFFAEVADFFETRFIALRATFKPWVTVRYVRCIESHPHGAKPSNIRSCKTISGRPLRRPSAVKQR